MMFLLIFHDFRKRVISLTITVFQALAIVFKVSQDDSFDSNGCHCDGTLSQHPGEKSQHKPSKATQTIARTTAYTACVEFRLEYCPMLLLMGHEFSELCSVRWAGKCRTPYLPAVDVDGTMLSSVYDLENFFRIGLRSPFSCQDSSPGCPSLKCLAIGGNA